MNMQSTAHLTIPAELVEAIRSFPRERTIEHCEDKIPVSPFDFYTSCPHCGSRVKLRSLSASDEIEDVFDAVFEWMQQPGAAELVRRRQETLKAEDAE
jgi:hypothetical protein